MADDSLGTLTMSDENEMLALNELTGVVHDYAGASLSGMIDCGCGLDEHDQTNMIAIHREHMERGIWEPAPCIEDEESDREETHECSVCGNEHTHTVDRYEFSPLGLDVTREKGPVTLIIDEYGDWSTEIDDGYTSVNEYWDEKAIRIVVDVVEEVN